MRDNQDAAAVFLQEVLQPAQGGKIQVVGRLVEEQQVGGTQQQGGQPDTRLFAARQGCHGAIVGQVADLQTGKDGGYPVVEVVAAKPVKLVGHQPIVGQCVVDIGGGRHGLFEIAQALFDGTHVLKRGVDQGADGETGARR